jgi:hypothetical protein
LFQKVKFEREVLTCKLGVFWLGVGQGTQMRQVSNPMPKVPHVMLNLFQHLGGLVVAIPSLEE